MNEGALGKKFRDGEVIVRQGDVGDCMYIIQQGSVGVFHVQDGREIQLTQLGVGDFFGEMAIVERELRSADVRAVGDVRVLTIDKRTFLSRVHDDPSLAYRIMQKLSGRIRELNKAVSHS